MFTNEQIIAYYDHTDKDYCKKWGQNSLSLGYWDETTRSLGQAIRRMNDVMIQTAQILSSDRVLDAGCGVGGPAVDLVQKTKCNVIGITLSQQQVNVATKYSEKQRVNHLTEFKVMDYCKTSFPDSAFDVVWARESVCHTPVKKDFIKEAYRLLKKGGRLIVVDGFKVRHSMTRKEVDLSKKVMHGFRVWDMDTIEDFVETIRAVGFDEIQVKDITQNVLRSIKHARYISFPGMFLFPLRYWLGSRNQDRLGNAGAAYFLYEAIQRNLFKHQLVLGVK